ncbi:hypothetical protein FACS1894113_3660 [Alphaproteobacteria bacterium]|nr:hypothetical protein FACS1894113_3660 [Alphaproteobacteria bacterium]
MFKFFSKKKPPEKPKQLNPTQKTLIDQLIFSPEKFSFSKAVDIALASQNLRNISINNMDISFKSSINFCSKYCDIKCVEGVKDYAVEIIANIGGIVGIESPFPDNYAEEYILYNRESKNAVIDFFDIFNDRFLALRYLFLKTHDISCLSAPIENSAIGNIMFALSGIDFGKKDKLKGSGIPEQLKISCQNLFWKKTRSSENLRIILSNFCESKVRIKQFSGKFNEIDDRYQTAIGKSRSQYNSLGKDSFLGNKVWNQMEGIDIFIGPLNFENYMKFLPKMSALDQKVSPLEKLKDIIKSYVPFGISVNLHFNLDKCYVNATYLNGINRLNKDSFLMGWHTFKNTGFSVII